MDYDIYAKMSDEKADVKNDQSLDLTDICRPIIEDLHFRLVEQGKLNRQPVNIVFTQRYGDDLDFFLVDKLINLWRQKGNKQLKKWLDVCEKKAIQKEDKHESEEEQQDDDPEEESEDEKEPPKKVVKKTQAKTPAKKK